MAKTIVEILTCDICNKQSKTSENTKTWLQWSRDHPVPDREWIEQCVCPSCLVDIKSAIKNQ